jgi:hypothetical protein
MPVCPASIPSRTEVPCVSMGPAPAAAAQPFSASASFTRAPMRRSELR